METKKCPKCGAEIPVEMSFCLHCMERTDGVLEIKRKSVPKRRYIIEALFLAAVLAAVILTLVKLNGKNSENGDTAPVAATENTTEISTESIQTETTETAAITTVQTQTTETTTTQEITTAATEPPTTTDFETVFTERMNAWGATHILTDTLSFTENGCTFTSNVGTDKVNCTVAANAEMTDFMLIIEPYNDYTSYQTAVYIPDIVNEVTYFVLDYKMSSSMRTDIALMFENFDAEGHFNENDLTCDITSQSHNNGSYPITVNCKITN